MGKWNNKSKRAVYEGIRRVGAALTRESKTYIDIADAFRSVYGHITFKWEEKAGKCGNEPVNSGGCTDNRHQIRFWSMSGHGQNDMDRMAKNVVHELGHAFDWTHYDPVTKTRASNHMPGGLTRDNVLRPNMVDGEVVSNYWDWQQSDKITPNEIFADMFLAWVYDTWNANPKFQPKVRIAQNWMNRLAQP